MKIRNGTLVKELADKVCERKKNKSTELAEILLKLYILYLFASEEDDDVEIEKLYEL